MSSFLKVLNFQLERGVITEPFLVCIKKVSLCTGSLKQSNTLITDPPYLEQRFLSGRRNHCVTVCLPFLFESWTSPSRLQTPFHWNTLTPVSASFVRILRSWLRFPHDRTAFPLQAIKDIGFLQLLEQSNLPWGWLAFGGEAGAMV